ncbi:hypothetical protein B0H67DRAFT_148518 [Lasiosphaeris hirsuta]|uniref:Ankyrin repeat protein n=1 Tax=Lasiosphaeris hirsuta TaxID=260670 RepID=A0AA40ANM5_9PEZI|nr:hypothetical protein B0H67DRAFT_148518 [Lasiosphaeris hirsuta]
MAAQRGSTAVMKRLIHSHAKINAIDSQDGPVINAAILSGNTEAVKMLLAKGVELSFTEDEANWAVAPLILGNRHVKGLDLDVDGLFETAAMAGEDPPLAVPKACWEKSGENIDKEILNRCLLSAAENNNSGCLDLLLEYGADRTRQS